LSPGSTGHGGRDSSRIRRQFVIINRAGSPDWGCPHNRKEKDMKGVSYAVVLAGMLLFVGIAGAQEFPIMEMIAKNVIQKYQQMNCEEMWKHKSEPKTAQQQEFIKILHSDPQMRTQFINKVSPAIVNKMFECGMIP
jgi:hypothetical protein